MAMDSATLLTHVQIALHMTQREMGALVGRDRRTIQRWQDRGCTLMPGEAATLAKALQAERPDLAAQVMALGDKGAGMAGIASATVIAAIVKAAAAAAGVSQETIKPGLVAAFAKANESRLSTGAVLVGLRRK